MLFAVPEAPAYVLTDGESGPNSREGDAVDVKLVPELAFDEKTCPMCLVQGGADRYSPNGSTQIYRQLRRMRIPAELHLFAGRRTPRPLGGLAKHTTAWQDLQRAVRLVRSQAKARGLDPEHIGIMGSSAGGHLTLMGVTSSLRKSYLPIDELDALSCGVQWAVAVYPAYALTDGVDRGNAQGGNEDDARPVREFSFDPKCCPVLFVHGDADGWAAMNSVKCWEQLRRMGVQCDLHTLATRSHCFQRQAAPGTGSYTWLDRIWEFLNGQGVTRLK